MRKLIAIPFAALLTLACAVAFAQSPTVNPTQAVFTASPQHSEVSPMTSTPLVTNYSMEVFEGTTLIRTTDLGKPTPAAGGDITVPLSKTGLQNNRTYTYHIVTNGPGGSARSATPSGPFAWETIPAPGAASNLRTVR